MAKKDRKLTPAEHKRKQFYEARVQELAELGYEKKDLTFGVVTANVLAILIMLPFVLLFCSIYFIMNQESITLHFNFADCITVLVSMLVLVVVHEGVHGITWAIFAKDHFHAVEFGFIWKMLTPYCTCRAELTKIQYALGAMMPTIIVGVVPAIFSAACNFPVLFVISIIMIISGGGDALIIIKLLLHRENGKDCIYMDHPYELGIIVFERPALKV